VNQVVAGRRVAALTHDLAGRPELSLDAISEVAARLSPADIEQHDADIPILHPTGQVRRLRLTFDEIVAGNATAWWVMLAGALNGMEPYPALATEVAEPRRADSAQAEGGLRERMVTLFVASPGSVVPWHIDYQHNVLVQVAGAKEVTVGEIPEIAIEQCVTSAVRNLRVPPAVKETFVLGPGDGLYLPPCTPHSVLGLEGVSISLSSMWVTQWGETERMARYWNARLRRLGIRPEAPRGGRMVDRAKALTDMLYGRWARRMRHS
jgi:hypothetical protein